jgi:hypothetical protein
MKLHASYNELKERYPEGNASKAPLRPGLKRHVVEIAPVRQAQKLFPQAG